MPTSPKKVSSAALTARRGGSRNAAGGFLPTAVAAAVGGNKVMIILIVIALCLVTMSLLPMVIMERSRVHEKMVRRGGGADFFPPEKLHHRGRGGRTADDGDDEGGIPDDDVESDDDKEEDGDSDEEEGGDEEENEPDNSDEETENGGDAKKKKKKQKKKKKKQKEANDNNSKKTRSYATRTTTDGRVIADLKLSDLKPDDDTFRLKPVARGVAGRPLEQTPSVKTAHRPHVECDFNIDSMAYWNVDESEDAFQPQPFVVPPTGPEKFITFSPDRGGWNNVRMSMEIIFVLAAATQRTLVLPPKEPLYLMHMDKENRYRGFGDFFPLQGMSKRVKVISFEEYINHPLAPPIPADIEHGVRNAADHCDRRDKSSNSCGHVFDYLKQTGTLVNISASHSCLVMDEESYLNGGRPPTETPARVRIAEYCGDRIVEYWNAAAYQDPPVLFFAAGEKRNRLLTHFYGMIQFTSPRLSHYYKRFVRDYLHYHDAIYCAAGKIVKAVQAEALLMLQDDLDKGTGGGDIERRLLVPDDEGAGGFSALHVRRGDLQYKKVKISAQEWYDNTKEVWYPNELLYVATDEKDKTFFNDIAKHHELRFLDDYWDLAGLQDLDPNYMGMIDTIVASRGRAFAGTWFSTFSGYINRLRGYHGMSMMDSWYSFLPKKTAVHTWTVVDDMAYAFEWPDGWVGIDADEWPSKDKF